MARPRGEVEPFAYVSLWNGLQGMLQGNGAVVRVITERRFPVRLPAGQIGVPRECLVFGEGYGLSICAP